jgi:hypothetical protein
MGDEPDSEPEIQDRFDKRSANGSECMQVADRTYAFVGKLTF